MKRITILLFCAFVIGTASATAGPLAPVAGPWFSGSWSERFGITIEYGLDRISVVMNTRGGTFEAPVLENFSSIEWSASSVGLTPSSALATGTAVDTLLFDIRFNFPDWTSSSFSFDFFAYNGSALKEWDTVDWNKDSQTWNVTVNQGDDIYRVPVPEPSVLPLLLCGFAWVALATRKRLPTP